MAGIRPHRLSRRGFQQNTQQIGFSPSYEKTEENNDEKSLTKPEDDFDPMEQMNKNMNMMML